jgi:predicted MPP superfamily phosphohydrolase
VGSRHALRLATHDIRITWPDLPLRFDGYRILHLTDLHLDSMDDTARTAAACAQQHGDIDLCVVTGDIRDDYRACTDQTAQRLEVILKAAAARDGVLCVLGNHDGPEMVAPLEALGIEVLLNEHISLARGNDRLHFTGLDDVHMFHTDDATEALRDAPNGFAVALVHSPEIAHIAAERHALYLTGHTHGGQICLPGGVPITTALRRHWSYASGLWRHDDMVGYTSHGAGTAGIPFRMNCPGEVSVVTLARGPRSASINQQFSSLWTD